MMSVWSYISLDINIYLSWSLSTISIKCHNAINLFSSCKPTNLVNEYILRYTYQLKTRLDIWTSMGVVLVDYGMFSHLFIFKIWLFQFINGITFMWYYVLLCIFGIMMWVFILNKLRIYRFPLDSFYVVSWTHISS